MDWKGRCPQNILQSFFFFSDIPSFPMTLCLSLASPTLLVYEGMDEVGIFFEEMWEVCNPFPTWCELHLPEGKRKTTRQTHFPKTGQQLYGLAFKELLYHFVRWQHSRDGMGSVRASEAYSSIPKKHPLRKQFGVSCKTWTYLAVWPTHHPCSSHTACLINNSN